MRFRTRPTLGVGVLLSLLCVTWGLAADSTTEERERRRGVLAREATRLVAEIAEFKTREQGVLAELNRIDAEIRLEKVGIERLGLELEDLEEETTRLQNDFETIAERRETIGRYLKFRLREMYKAGRSRELRRIVVDPDASKFLDGWRTATALNERDADRWNEWRQAGLDLQQRTALLEEQYAGVAANRETARKSRRRLESTRGKRRTLLASLQSDRLRRQTALDEIARAGTALNRLAESGESTATRSIEKFKGLLDWPLHGRVSSAFGRQVHPRFKTVVPHPGLDIDADMGKSIQAVFDGEVRFASWLEGYGLMVILDHGDGVLSIYAHASVLQVEKGNTVMRGDNLARVGETGSLRGPYLYFEMRESGKAVDPIRWLRPR